MRLTLTRTSRTKVSALVRDGDTTVHRLTFNPDSVSARATLCRAVNCDDATVLGWLDQLDRSPEDPRRFEVTLGAATVAPTGVEVRDFNGKTLSSHGTDRLVQVLAGPLDHLLCWTDKAALACLDVDYHGTTPPRPEVIESWMARLSPAPVVWHMSRGGGVHAFYLAQPPFTAEHLACAAALRYSAIDPSAGLEIKTQVRLAGDARLHTAPAGQDTLGVLSSWLGRDTVEEDDARDWLGENGYERGVRYNHDRCPIAPSESDGNPPVVVGERGIYCFRCAGKGLSLGSRAPGFAPYAALCGAPSSGEVGQLVKHLAHWGHAKHVLTERYGLAPALARPAYEAALLATHPDKAPVIPSAFHPDSADVARVNRSWMSLESNFVYTKTDAILSTLPTCLSVDPEGKVKRVPSAVEYLSQGCDLTNRGYQDLQVIHGFAFARPFLPPPNHTTVCLPAAELRYQGRPRYLPRAGRKTADWAWDRLEQIFPRINRQYVRALLCAAASAQETRLGLHPLIFTAGTSATAKTMHSVVAASIMGAHSGAVTYQQDEGRLRQQIMDMSQRGPILRADEFLKESKRSLRAAWSPKAALETVLTLTPDTLVHVLYLGPRRLGRLPVLVITETVCPVSIKQYTQIARRVRFIQLHGSKRDWKDRMADAGLTGDTMIRLRLVSDEMAEACDVILSDVVDEFFCLPMTWDAQADRLGLPTIEDSEDFLSPTPQLLRFYQLVCTVPAQTDKPGTRYKARDGWRRVSKNEMGTPEQQELVDLLDGFSDEQGKTWGQSVVLAEKSWGDLLKVDTPVMLDIEPQGSSTAYVRFRVGPPAKPFRINGQIKPPSEVTVE